MNEEMGVGGHRTRYSCSHSSLRGSLVAGCLLRRLARVLTSGGSLARPAGYVQFVRKRGRRCALADHKERQKTGAKHAAPIPEEQLHHKTPSHGPHENTHGMQHSARLDRMLPIGWRKRSTP